MKRAVVLLALAACGDGGAGGPDAAAADRCAEDGAVDLEGDLCERLSTYGLFADVAAQEPAAGVIRYDVNSALFSDYTDKHRFLVVPDGATIPWHDEASLEMPAGTILVKTFAYGERLLETRLLIRQAAGWTGASYVYDETGVEAHLAVAGETIEVTDPVENAYAVPNKNQCKNCHEETEDILGLIGPKVRHLNRDGQLEALIDAGILTGAPADPATWPRTPVFDDPDSGTVEARARAWLEINCAHCHNPAGAARTSGLDLRASQTTPFEYGVCKPPVAAGSGSGGRPYSIVPGDPDQSILVYRIESTEADVKMPELGRNLVHAEGVALVREWIAAMPAGCP